MLDEFSMKKREEIFEEYRRLKQETNEAYERINQLRSTVNQLDNEYREKRDAAARAKALIDIMIDNDCDPFQAKIIYSEQAAQMEGVSQDTAEDAWPLSTNKAMPMKQVMKARHILGAKTNSIV